MNKKMLNFNTYMRERRNEMRKKKVKVDDSAASYRRSTYFLRFFTRIHEAEEIVIFFCEMR